MLFGCISSFYLISQENKACILCSLSLDLHEMSHLIFWENV